MNREKYPVSGVLRSREMRLLAKPLAFLLAMLFSLSIHINASVAAGSLGPLCLSIKTIDKQDGGSTSRRTQIEHCSLCTISGDEIGNNFPWLGTVYYSQKSYLNATTFNLLFSNKPEDTNSIRGPPLS